MLCPTCDAIRFPSAVSKRTDNHTPPVSSKMSKKNTVTDTARSKSGATQRIAVGPQTTSTHVSGPRASSICTDAMKTDLNDSTDECCPCCLEMVDEECIRCNVCKNKIHQTCSGMNHDVYKTLMKIIHQSFWVCGQCRGDMYGCRVAVTKINEELADMRSYVDKLSHELNELKKTNADNFSFDNASRTSSKSTAEVASKPVSVSNDQTKFAAVIHRTVRDIERRKKNVIISGLPEPNLSTEAENKTADETAFNDLCELHLPVKPPLGPLGCKRLGQHSNRGPRRLLVQLTSEESTSSLLTVAKQLRRSTDQHVAANVYINRDLSPTEEKEAYEKRQRIRARKYERENDQHHHQQLLYQSTTDLQTAAPYTDTAVYATTLVAPYNDTTDATTPFDLCTTPLDAAVSSFQSTYQPSDGTSKSAKAGNTLTTNPSPVIKPFRV